MYGITETTVHVTYRPLKDEDIRSGRGSVIGIPIPDLELYVLDSKLQPVPVGAPGELYVGGAGLARGYLNRPKLTEERFVPHLFSSRRDARLYKTGDIVRYFLNRDLEYLGRADEQVQIRGFRVELGEIEACIVEYGAIRQAVVVVRQDHPGDHRLIAYFVPKSNTAVSISDLRAHLGARLPSYMLPQHYVKLKTIPLTPNGKVDRQGLPEPPADRQTESPCVPPRTRTERIISEIWKEVLHVKQVGIQDTFFELGGHSLLIVQLVSKLNESLGVKLSVVDFFKYPTIDALAQFLTKQQDIIPSFVPNRDLIRRQRTSYRRRKRTSSPDT